MRWTDEQHEAITAGGNLIISAAAGSGKTAVLTERIARLISEGAEPEEFLVVTFTRAAAAEMKKRIAARLFALAQEARGEAAARLSRCAQDIGRASISTIDAFCAQLLRRHFHRAGLDPAFRAAEEAEAEVLRQEAMEELLEEKYAEGPFCALVDAFGGEDEFIEGAHRLYDFLCAQPKPLHWLRRAVDEYGMGGAELARSPIAREALRAAKEKAAAAMEGLICQRDGIARAFPATAAILDDDIMQLRALLMQDTYPGYAAQLEGIAFQRFSMRGGEGRKEQVMKARDKVKDVIKAQRAAFALPIGEQAERIGQMRPAMEELYSFMEAFTSAYAEKKREAGVIDYADMEHLALEALEDEAVAGEYRQRFTYLFVDEYQDCNPVQDSIFERLRREDNLFLVGDVKQSIYRFRMAEPALFTGKLKAFEAGEGRALPLSRNFRSAAAVIDGVNLVFSAAMTEELGGVDYSGAALRAGRGGAKGGAELHILPRRPPLDPEEYELEGDGEQLSAAEAEALLAAERIRELVDTRFTDAEGRLRKYRYSDIVILHSAPKRVAEAWVQTLSREGVPAYADMAGGYFDAVEVQVFMNLLRLIDNPLQDIPLLSVLRSPIGGFTTEELILLRSDFPADTCYGSLALAGEDETPLGAAAKGFLARLAKWRRDAALYGAAELIAMLLDDTGYEGYVSALPGGAARRGNLEALVQAAAACQKRGGGLNAFLRFMDRVKDTGRMGAAQIASANVVRIISIHKSKGLEFPVVILAGLSREFNDSDRTARLVMDSELGLGLRPVKGHVKLNNLRHSAVASRCWLMSVSEQLRTLYVAMTRASDRLIMLCSFRDVEEELAKRAGPLTPAVAQQAMCYADWVVRAAASAICGQDGPIEAHIHRGISALNQGGALPPEQYRRFAAEALEAGPGALARELGWEYPYIGDTLLPSKISVSAYLGNLPELPEYPAFLRDRAPATPVSRGSAAHALMERIPIAPHTPDTVRSALMELTAQGTMTPAQAELVDANAIAAFFQSGLGKRMLASERVERELPFNHRVRAGELGMEGEEEVLLQGIIDCCFMEDGEWVLLDYKTDMVPEGRERQAALRHRPQLELYRNALSALTGVPVREMYIHFLRTGRSARV